MQEGGSTVGDIESESSHRRTGGRRALARVAVLVILLCVVGLVAYRLGWLDFRRATALVARLRAGHDTVTAGAIFVVVSAIGIAIGLAAIPFTVAGGVIFGHTLGSVLSWAGAVLGSMLGYAIARAVGRDTAPRWLTRKSIGERLTEGSSFLTLLRIRLIPIVPLSVVNFAAGLARTRFAPYVAATAIGILPVTIIFAYFADSLTQGFAGARAHAYKDLAIACGTLMLITGAWSIKRKG